ncbi:unnamed protein product [Colias eurytheme]|nr:unnamed protein product [Colias eurytheme]
MFAINNFTNSLLYFAANDSIHEIQGINLSNYVRDQRSYNPVVYIHKKYLPSTPYFQDKSPERKTSDKCLQYNQEKNHGHYKTKVINHINDPVVEQTIKFAKDIIPLTIPPSTNDSTNPVYYNIKTKKVPKRKKHEGNLEHDKDVTYEKEKPKTANNFKDEKVRSLHSFSTRESISRSSQNNTLDDINENRSLCCSLSEFSEKKNLKRERCCHKSKHNDVHLIASESFEALAEQLNTSDDAKIKIHLMNEKDKGLLCESIRTPVIKAIQECILDLHKTNDANVDLQYIQRNVQNNTQKLEYILEKLASIERKVELFNDHIKNKDKEKVKISKLEELEQDVITRENSSEEEVAQIHFGKRRKSKSVVVALSPKQEEDETEDDKSIEIMDRGEGLGQFQQTANVGVRTDRPGRIPARFCWTDANKQNLQRKE